MATQYKTCGQGFGDDVNLAASLPVRLSFIKQVMLPSSSGLRIFLVDSIGAHRGMHYYNFALSEALEKMGVDVLMLSTPETVVHPWKPEGVSVKGVFRHIYGKQPKWIRGLWYGWALLWIAWLSWRQRPDLIHWHFYQIPVLDCLLLQWLKWIRITTVSTVHDVIPLTCAPSLQPKDAQYFRSLYALSDGLIVHSNQSLVSLSVLETSLLAKTTLIPHGHFLHVAEHLTHSQTQARQVLELAVEGPVILVFGSIKPNKRLDWAIKVLANVAVLFSDIRLVIVGRPQDQDIMPFRILAEELNVTDRVHWCLDVVDDALLLAYFSAADVVLFPYEWIYQSGVLIMAMSLGKPVVATAVGGNNDIIIHNKTGLLVKPGDIMGMSQALITLLSHPKKAQQMGVSAKKYVRTMLSWEYVAIETHQYYLQLLADDIELDLPSSSRRVIPFQSLE